MPNFQSSVLNLGQAKFTERYIGLGEWRPVDYAAITVMQKGEIANPSLAELRTAENRLQTAYMPVRSASTGGTERTYDHDGNLGDSIAVPTAWSVLTETFKTSLAISNNNVLNAAEMFASDLKNAIDNLLIRSNDLLIAQLLADKTQVSAGGANGSFSGSFNWEIPLLYKDTYYNEVTAMMKRNRYNVPLISIVDAKAFVLAQHSGMQGTGNGVNLAWTLAGQSITQTNSDILTTGFAGSSITFQAGATAFTPWIPLMNRKPIDANKILTTVGDYGQIAIPELGVVFSIHAYSERADTSAIGGSKQDVITQYEIGIDWSYASSPINVANESTVFVSGLLSA